MTLIINENGKIVKHELEIEKKKDHVKKTENTEIVVY